MSPSKRVRSLRSDYSRNHLTILEVAKTLYQREGAGVAWSDIAKETGFTLPTLYTHFPTREDLIKELFAQMVNEMTTGLSEFSENTEIPVFKKLEKILEYLSKGSLSNPAYQIILQEFMRMNPAGRVFEIDSEIIAQLFSELESTKEVVGDFNKNDLSRILSLPLRLCNNANVDLESLNRLMNYVVRGIQKNPA